MPFLPAAVRRTTAVTLMALALSWAGATAAEAAGDPPSLEDCYTLTVTDPTTGQGVIVDVCPPV